MTSLSTEERYRKRLEESLPVAEEFLAGADLCGHPEIRVDYGYRLSDRPVAMVEKHVSGWSAGIVKQVFGDSGKMQGG